ncbi:hypothetical protein [Halarcobacter anaerophilus]|uniref:hypothetical protein n=1 Tax=Halarcobacter anaerophilus TaxID=877500 RepID=UPI0005CB002E|nr:hypothetical protein [Halarcobacter anaerophilus]
MNKKTTVSARLSETEIAIINSVSSSRKISKSEAISYIIRSYSDIQNQSILSSFSNEIQDLKSELSQSLFIIRSLSSRIEKDVKTTKYLSLYNFAERTNKELAKSYLDAAEKRSLSEIKG